MMHRIQAVAAHLRPTPASAARTAAMSTSHQVHNDNIACCTVPAVQSDYTPKGSIRPYAGFKSAYITGPATSETAVVCVYDIFGFKPQTQQGADRLADALHARVVMPDFFEPNRPWDTAQFPPRTDAARAQLQAFFGGTANPQKNVEKLLCVGRALRGEGVRRIGVYGLCWGGKVSILAGGVADTPFDAVGVLHPAMLKAEDTIPLDLPLAIYITKDESLEEYQKIVKIMKNKAVADKVDNELYQDMFHGFAGARGDLDDPLNKKRFEEVYARLAKYFQNVLQN
ncbi:dienelactone hydrolase [Dentipellis sp. KUC8613]|nr:dienelactone hydrolase [Dentipellis sp. KUC8613]